MENMMRGYGSEKKDLLGKAGRVVLGEGASGSVFLTNQGFARKIANPGYEQHIQYEAGLLNQLQHQHIIRVAEYFVSDSGAWMDLEYCEGGNLLVRWQLGLPFQAIWMVALSGAVKYLAARQVVHRDIKPDNVLITTDMDLKLCDFGLARVLPPGGFTEGEHVGSVPWWPPEMFSSLIYGFFSDVWAVVAIVDFMLGDKDRNFEAYRQEDCLERPSASDLLKSALSFYLEATAIGCTEFLPVSTTNAATSPTRPYKEPTLDASPANTETPRRSEVHIDSSSGSTKSEDMGQSLGKEQEDDDAQHRELACWCNNHNYEKDQAIEQSTSKISELESSVDSLPSETSELKTSVKEDVDDGHREFSQVLLDLQNATETCKVIEADWAKANRRAQKLAHRAAQGRMLAAKRRSRKKGVCSCGSGKH